MKNLKKLFDTDTPKKEFIELSAEGFTKPAAGVVFTDANPPCCGVPLGGIGTGCIDYDIRGIFGWSSIFNPVSQHFHDWPDECVPRKPPNIQPVFGFSLGSEVYVLATEEMIKGGKIKWCTAPSFYVLQNLEKPPQDFIDIVPTPDVHPAKHIDYFGHYPVADVEYGFDVPINVGVRAWSSFIPGDSAKTNIPAAIFEVHVRNESNVKQDGNFAMNFAGPDHQEARSLKFSKTVVGEGAKGVYVASDGGVNYFLGVLDEENVMTGTGLSANNKMDFGYATGYYAKKSAWKNISKGLPQDERFEEMNGLRKYEDPSASVAVRFDLEGGHEKIYRFILAWCAPRLISAVRRPEFENGVASPYTSEWVIEPAYGAKVYVSQMYATRYRSSLDVMRRLSDDHGILLRKILAWQEVLLSRETIPLWLRDSLVNILCLLTENGYWFAPEYPLGDWSFPNGGFGYYESPRDCPHTCAIPNDWISTVHIMYMFPDLNLQLLRAYKAMQKPDGEIPLILGVKGAPSLMYPGYFWQMSLNAVTYISMIDRLWLVTKNDALLIEFYDSIKSSHIFTRSLAEKGWICIADRGGSEWFENSAFYGYCSHIGILHLSQLLIVERMAQKMDDHEFAKQCRRDFETAKNQLDEKLWAGTHYLTWYDEDAGKKNDDIMAYQLDGIFMNAQSGIWEKLIDDKRVETVLDTIWDANVKLGNGYGALNYARVGGEYMTADEDRYGRHSIFTQNTIVLAMTCMYCGQYERGMKLAEDTWRNLVLNQGLGWDMTHVVDAKDGSKVFGADYNQQSVIWSLLAAMEGGDLGEPLKEGGVVSDILKAAAG